MVKGNISKKSNDVEYKLKVVCMGFDWDNIAFNNISFTKSKLDRDGLKPDFNEFLLLYAGSKCKRQEISKNPFFLTWHICLLSRLRIFYDLFFIFFLPAVLLYESYEPDFYYLSDFPYVLSAIIPARLGGSKIYFRLVNLPTELALTKGVKGRLYYLYYRLIEKLAIPFIDHFIVINETTKKYLMDLGVKERQIILDIPDTIARDKLHIEKADKNYIRQKYNISINKKIILSIGSLLQEKGFSELIKVFAKLKRNDLILIICGKGKELENLKNLCKKFGVKEKIIFAGFIGREKIWHYFVGADIFILFSKSESLGMVFWEAMYAGLPIIGTPVGGVKETIGNDGERGFYWQNDLKDLKNKINFYLNNKIAKKKELVIKRAKEYVEQKMKTKKNINEIFFNHKL